MNENRNKALTLHEKWAADSEDFGNGLTFYDNLEFRLTDPYEAGEAWAVEFGYAEKSVEIWINGTEIAEMVTRIEKNVPENKPVDMSESDYGHIGKSLLYRFLSGELEDEYGIPLLCCRDCGDTECDSVRCSIREENKSVVWENITKNGRKKIGEDLSFRFHADDYHKQLENLKNMVAEAGNEATL